MGAALFLCPAENCGKRENGKKGGRKGERWKNGKEKGKKICRIGKFSPPLGTVKRKITTRNEERNHDLKNSQKGYIGNTLTFYSGETEGKQK